MLKPSLHRALYMTPRNLNGGWLYSHRHMYRIIYITIITIISLLGLYMFYAWLQPNGGNSWDPARGLRQIGLAQAEFYRQDIDNNGINDFWREDIAGLKYLMVSHGNYIDLITPDIAAADDYLIRMPGIYNITYHPINGYTYVSLRYRGEYSYDRKRFAVGCYPVKYDLHDPHMRKTFILNEEANIYMKDMGGVIIDTYPANPEKEGWIDITTGSSK